MKRNPHLPGSADEFIKKNLKLASSVAWKFAVKDRDNPNIKFDEDDYMSIAYIGLIKAYQRFDPTKFSNENGQPVQFSTYAVPIIAGCIMIETRDFAYTIRNKDRKGPKIPTTSLDEPIKFDGHKPLFYGDMVGKSDNFNSLIVRDFVSSLPNKLKKLYELRVVREFSQDQIAKVFGCSQAQICRLEKQMIKLAEEYGRESLGVEV